MCQLYNLNNISYFFRQDISFIQIFNRNTAFLKIHLQIFPQYFGGFAMGQVQNMLSMKISLIDESYLV